MALPSPSQGIWFPQWAEVLARAPLKDLERRTYRRAIFDYLAFCKRSRQRATVASAREFMERLAAQCRLGQVQLASWQTALNWFFKEAKASPANPGTAQTSQQPTACSWGKEPPLGGAPTITGLPIKAGLSRCSTGA
ncbi:MAG: hypothetical protein WCH99_04760 [Verrucomicrobiota bacterium]